jgi:hypothetical protein
MMAVRGNGVPEWITTLLEALARTAKVLALPLSIAAAIYLLLGKSLALEVAIDPVQGRAWAIVVLLVGVPLSVLPLSARAKRRLERIGIRVTSEVLYHRLPLRSRLYLGPLAEGDDDGFFGPRGDEALQRLIDLGVLYVRNSGRNWISVKPYTYAGP